MFLSLLAIHDTLPDTAGTVRSTFKSRVKAYGEFRRSLGNSALEELLAMLSEEARKVVTDKEPNVNQWFKILVEESHYKGVSVKRLSKCLDVPYG